jgi:hypothetical protein
MHGTMWHYLNAEGTTDSADNLAACLLHILAQLLANLSDISQALFFSSGTSISSATYLNEATIISFHIFVISSPTITFSFII